MCRSCMPLYDHVDAFFECIWLIYLFSPRFFSFVHRENPRNCGSRKPLMMSRLNHMLQSLRNYKIRSQDAPASAWLWKKTKTKCPWFIIYKTLNWLVWTRQDWSRTVHRYGLELLHLFDVKDLMFTSMLKFWTVILSNWCFVFLIVREGNESFLDSYVSGLRKLLCAQIQLHICFLANHKANWCTMYSLPQQQG